VNDFEDKINVSDLGDSQERSLDNSTKSGDCSERVNFSVNSDEV